MPNEYRNSLLVAIWNENSIERFDLRPSEGSLEGTQKSVFLKGGKNFRPVSVDCDSRGNLFISDWVLVDYPNHGRGRIWRVSAKDKSNCIEPQPYLGKYLPDSTTIKLENIAQASSENDLVRLLNHSDPFVQHAAQLRIAGEPKLHQMIETLKDRKEAQIRLAALLIEKRIGTAKVDSIRSFLSDTDPLVRQGALMWAGESLNQETRPLLQTALQVRPVTTAVFESYLAALQNLDGEFVQQFNSKSFKKSKDIPRQYDSNVLRQIATNLEFSDELRAMAIAKFDDDAVAANWSWLLQLLDRGSDELALAAIRRAIAAPSDLLEIREALSLTAESKVRSPEVRCEALLALGTLNVPEPKRFMPLLIDENDDIALEAARTFRAWLDVGDEVDCVSELERLQLRPEVKLMLSYAKQGTSFGGKPLESRPMSNDEWRQALEIRGSADRGSRVFRSSRIGCSTCHTVDGRGGVLGPDLSGVAQSKSRRQIIDAILDPSADFPPQYQAWMVVTADGLTHRGLQLDHKSGGAIELITELGTKRRFEAQDIEEYAALPASLMPSGLPETMTVGEFRDLVEFLVSLQN